MKPENEVRILLAEDDEDDRFMFAEAIRRLGLNVEVNYVHDGWELMTLLKANSRDLPDMLFLDLNMPLKNGMDCLFEIKSNADLQILPVIVISTTTQQKWVENAYKLGADLFIKKPETLRKLAEILQVVFERYSIYGDIAREMEVLG